MNHQELIERLRVLEIDHEPNGWPAIQMRDISAMCDAIRDQRDELLAALTFARQGYQASSENGEPDEVEWAEMYLRSIDVAIASVKENSDGH